MAYNPYYPYPYQAQQPQQNNAFISARTIEEAYNWPVAPGNSLTFKIENSPFVCTKTKGFSPLEQPVFERYRLVKEEDAPQAPVTPAVTPAETPNYDDQIKQLWDEVNALKNRMKWRNRHDKPADDKSGEAISE